MQLKRFILASIRIILLREQMLALQKAKAALIQTKEHPNTIYAITLEIDRVIKKKERLKEYVKIRFEFMIFGEYDYDMDNFSYLTRKDIEKGFYALDSENAFVLSTGKIISLNNAEFGPLPSVSNYFDFIWPL